MTKENTLDFFIDGIFRCSLETTKNNILGDIEEMVDSDSIIDIKLSTDKVQVRTNIHTTNGSVMDDDYMWDTDIDDKSTTG